MKKEKKSLLFGKQFNPLFFLLLTTNIMNFFSIFAFQCKRLFDILRVNGTMYCILTVRHRENWFQ